MKAYRIELLVIDFGWIGPEETKAAIEDAHYPNRCISPSVIEMTEADIGAWDDGHPLNNRATKAVEFRRLFAEQPK